MYWNDGRIERHGIILGLIETWDVLKSIQVTGFANSAAGLIETWDVLK